MKDRLEETIAARIARAGRKFNKAPIYIENVVKGYRTEIDALATDVDPESDMLSNSGVLLKYRRAFVVSEESWKKIQDYAGGEFVCDVVQIVETGEEYERRYKIDYPLVAKRFADGRARRILATQIEGNS